MVKKDYVIQNKIKKYIDILKDNDIHVWRLYLYGSFARGKANKYSDIDLAIFLNQDDLDGFDEDVLLMKLRRKVDLRIEAHPFARTDFDLSNPIIKEIVETGERII